MNEEEIICLVIVMIYCDFELEFSDKILLFEEVFCLLSDYVDWLMEYCMEWLFSLMYWMDIDECLVEVVFLFNVFEFVNIGLVKLILVC